MKIGDRWKSPGENGGISRGFWRDEREIPGLGFNVVVLKGDMIELFHVEQFRSGKTFPRCSTWNKTTAYPRQGPRIQERLKPFALSQREPAGGTRTALDMAAKPASQAQRAIIRAGPLAKRWLLAHRSHW